MGFRGVSPESAAGWLGRAEPKAQEANLQEGLVDAAERVPATPSPRGTEAQGDRDSQPGSLAALAMKRGGMSSGARRQGLASRRSGMSDKRGRVSPFR